MTSADMTRKNTAAMVPKLTARWLCFNTLLFLEFNSKKYCRQYRPELRPSQFKRGSD
jgi:hypothetical protein